MPLSPGNPGSPGRPCNPGCPGNPGLPGSPLPPPKPCVSKILKLATLAGYKQKKNQIANNGKIAQNMCVLLFIKLENAKIL